MVKLKVNGKPFEAEAEITLRELLDLLAMPGRIAVAVNGEVVRRPEHETRMLHEGDEVEVIQAVAGG